MPSYPNQSFQVLAKPQTHCSGHVLGLKETRKVESLRKDLPCAHLVHSCTFEYKCKKLKTDKHINEYIVTKEYSVKMDIKDASTSVHFVGSCPPGC